MPGLNHTFPLEKNQGILILRAALRFWCTAFALQPGRHGSWQAPGLSPSPLQRSPSTVKCSPSCARFSHATPAACIQAIALPAPPVEGEFTFLLLVFKFFHTLLPAYLCNLVCAGLCTHASHFHFLNALLALQLLGSRLRALLVLVCSLHPSAKPCLSACCCVQHLSHFRGH